ncbi:MAG: guanylyltransferase [Lachnospiraceae bacterium]|nr:guanylyltransferase [Lachnospiraceae bacterium]MBR3736912.1 guanylyltransferase [Lachnospiraceae bacterium]
MNFDDFDAAMRTYEQSLDQKILPKMYIVARLDGRGFTKMTNEHFEKPFDERFKNMMVEVTRELMKNSGFRVIYGYTQSDEISLLFAPDENSFGRKVRKINTTLAGIASAKASLMLGEVVSLDCRIAPLPNKKLVEDYFSWRQQDCFRNALNGWCYWTLRKEGASRRQATSILAGKGDDFKNELLFERGVNFNDTPAWQRRGVGLYYKEIEREGYNPKTGETVVSKRNELFLDEDIPCRQKYRDFVTTILETTEQDKVGSKDQPEEKEME